MKLFHISRIGKRIAALVAISVLMSILMITCLLVWFQVSESIESRKDGLKATGYVYAAAIADAIAAGDRQQATNVLRSVARVPNMLFAAALDRDNNTLATMGSAVFLKHDVVQEEQGIFAMLAKGALPVAVDIVRGGEVIGRLVLFEDVRNIRSNLYWTLFATMAAALAASLFGAAIAIPLQSRITSPILSLIKAMRQIKDSRQYNTKVDHQADDETGELVATFNQMITEISYRDASLQKLAYFDALTGLPNRQFFQKQIAETIAKSTGTEISAALILLDLDGFKQINDAFGHTVGDGLLLSLAAGLKQETTSGARLARLGGDEFAVILENVSSENDVQAKIAPFIAALHKPAIIINHQIHVSASVGVAMIPRDGKSSDELMRRADLALNSAKHRGSGLIHFFQPSMDAVIKEKTEIALRLRQAIANNEFKTHYQPLINMQTGDVYGFECLLRWKNGVRGYVPPSEFIPIAESTGVIVEIGKWILRDSCTQVCAWLAEGHAPVEISVNVSATQILLSDFAHDVRAILQQTGFPPHLLCLELTESLFIDKSVVKVRQVLDDLRALGILLALDDFGTGYSSLYYLEKLPFDKLKIDRSFVSGCENNKAKQKILSGIIMLAHSLGMEVVAEGVETLGELSLLRDIGADHVQGYALSRPVPADQALTVAQTITKEFPVKFGFVSDGIHPPKNHRQGTSGSTKLTIEGRDYLPITA